MRTPDTSSISIPISTSTTLIISRITIGFSEMEKMNSCAIAGMSSNTSSRLTIITMKNITMTAPVVADDSITAALRPFQSIPR